MNLEWAGTVLRKAEKNEDVTHLIISVGINNKNQKSRNTSYTALKRLRTAAKAKFPKAERRIALINYSEGLSTDQKDVLTYINGEIMKEPHLPKLPANSFKTDDENVHWLRDTAESMLQHWINSLN